MASRAFAEAYWICDGPMRTWQTIRSATLPLHSHQKGYAALVLSGTYEEAGDQGRFYVKAGDVIFHDCFEAHLNRFSSSVARVLNLPLSAVHPFKPGLASIKDMDLLVRTAELDQTEATNLLLHMIERRTPVWADWPDELAAVLIEDPSLRLTFWANQKTLSPWAVSRGFAKVFGISPEAFRPRALARRAWRAIRTSKEPLAMIAAHLGFADQSHMTRSVMQLTGMAPRAWRGAANGFKTGGGMGA